MSIASEITRLQGVKTNILQAISDKGVEVPSGSMLADCPNLIASISGGGGGGIITQLPDAAINGNLFKNLLPFCTYQNGVLVDDNLILKNFIDNNNPFLLFQGDNFTLSNNDTFELKFTVRKSTFQSTKNTVFGSVNSYYNNISMDFGNVNNNGKSIFFGVPRSDSPSSWKNPLNITDLQLTENKWYSVEVVADDNKVTLSVVDDVTEKTADVPKNNLSANSPLQLMGINMNINNAFHGEIDLKNSYIKKNGVLIWGMT